MVNSGAQNSVFHSKCVMPERVRESAIVYETSFGAITENLVDYYKADQDLGRGLFAIISRQASYEPLLFSHHQIQRSAEKHDRILTFVTAKI